MSAGFRDLLRLLLWFWPGDQVPVQSAPYEIVHWSGSVDSAVSFTATIEPTVRWKGAVDSAVAIEGEV